MKAKLTQVERVALAAVMASISEDIEAGTSLTMQDLTDEAADLIRRAAAEDGEDLPLIDLEEF